MENPFSKLFKLKLGKKQLIIIGIIIVALIIISLTVYFILRGKHAPTLINNDAKYTMQEGFADDSESALGVLYQPYDTEDTEPTYDLYGEVGTPNEDSTYNTVQTSSDFSPDSEECDTLEEGSCINLGREKTVMPNHSTVNLTVWESYATEWSDEGLPGARVGLKAYAVLPDASMASIYHDSKVQFNFYDKETRIVQMEGEVYYRVKAQEDGHVFTVQAGDRLIELNDTEAYIQVVNDIDERVAKLKKFGKFESNLDYANDPYIMQEEQDRRSGEVEKEMEEYNRKSEEYSKNIYAVRVYITSGSAKMYSRSNRDTILYELTGDNPYTIFKFREYGKMEAYQAEQEEIEKEKEILATGFESTEFFANINFSMSNYGIGNFAEISKEDLINMLQININAIEPQARRTAAWYKKDMDKFISDWNEFVKKTSCKPGWYQATSTTCCPDGYIWNSSEHLCTKTIYTYYCDDGYTLGSDNMCHKTGSSSTSALKPIMGDTSERSSCVDSSKPATYQLCRMGISVGTAKMNGSKCCFTIKVDPPELVPLD